MRGDRVSAAVRQSATQGIRQVHQDRVEGRWRRSAVPCDALRSLLVPAIVVQVVPGFVQDRQSRFSVGNNVNYYNENDPHAAQWIRNLIAAKLIPNGIVDDRSIEDVQPSDLDGFVQHHFFCGIAGWSLALEIAGWSPDEPVFTGSPPCQPFSAAGGGEGISDKRHLWPAWFRLIREYRPHTILLS